MATFGYGTGDIGYGAPESVDLLLYFPGIIFRFIPVADYSSGTLQDGIINLLVRKEIRVLIVPIVAISQYSFFPCFTPLFIV